MSDICELTPSSNSQICPTLGTAPSESVHLLKKDKLLQECKRVYEDAKGEARNIQYDSLDGYSFTYPAYQDPSTNCACAQRDPRFRFDIWGFMMILSFMFFIRTFSSPFRAGILLAPLSIYQGHKFFSILIAIDGYIQDSKSSPFANVETHD